MSARADGIVDSEPRHIHGEVTIVAAELDPTLLPLEWSNKEGDTGAV
jgi:hypothetical protein